MAGLSATDVGLQAADGTAVLRDVTLALAPDELVGLLGPSGSGKSALLRVLAGLEHHTSGTLLVDGRPPQVQGQRHRDVVLVNAERTLEQVLGAIEEMALPDVLRRIDPPEEDQAPRRWWHRLLGPPAGRGPSRRAGEPRRPTLPRRVMVAAMGRLPAALLLDEPLRRLDPQAQAELQGELRALLAATGIPTMLATNDHGQVVSTASRLVVLREGAVVQDAPTAEVLASPVDTFVATFVGPAPMSLLTGTVRQEGDVGLLDVGERRLRFPGGLPGALRDRVGRTVALGLRPAAVTLADPAHRDDERLPATVRHRERQGHRDLVALATAGGALVAAVEPRRSPAVGERCEVHLALRDASAFDADGRAVWHGGAR